MMKISPNLSPAIISQRVPALAGGTLLIGCWRAIKRWYLRRQTRLLLGALSDHQLKDLGLSRSDISTYGND